MNLKFINSNKLKCIAIMAVIIDHIAVYFSKIFGQTEYIALRVVGRIAMPLFAFMIVEGFFHTKNINKYVSRLFTVRSNNSNCSFWTIYIK